MSYPTFITLISLAQLHGWCRIALLHQTPHPPSTFSVLQTRSPPQQRPFVICCSCNVAIPLAAVNLISYKYGTRWPLISVPKKTVNVEK